MTDWFERIGLFSFLVINGFGNPFSRLEAAVGDSKKQIPLAPIGTRGVLLFGVCIISDNPTVLFIRSATLSRAPNLSIYLLVITSCCVGNPSTEAFSVMLPAFPLVCTMAKHLPKNR